MDVSRRGFLKLSGLSIAAFATGLGFDPAAAKAKGYALKLEGSKKIPSICHFCSGGCGILLFVKEGKLIHIEGDPDHPTNEGTLCPKGASLHSVAYAPNRLTKPKRRAPGLKIGKKFHGRMPLIVSPRKQKQSGKLHGSLPMRLSMPQQDCRKRSL